MRLTVFFILIASCFIYVVPLLAQPVSLNQQQFWLGYNGIAQFSSKWNIQLELQERSFIDPLAQHQALGRLHLNRKIGNSNWSATAGMSCFVSKSNNPSDAVRIGIPELRPHLQIAQKQQNGKLTIDHRYRAEARFFHSTNDTKTMLEDGFTFNNFRLRYRIQLTYLIKEFNNNKAVKLKINDEIHLNAGKNSLKNIFDQNRIYGAVNLELSKKIALELGYIRWIQQRSDGNFIHRNIFRFVLFHKLDFTKE